MHHTTSPRRPAAAVLAFAVLPLAVAAVTLGANPAAGAAPSVTWQYPATTTFAGAPHTVGALVGPDRGFRYEVSFNAIDLSATWDNIAPTPAAGIDDAIAKWGPGATMTQLYFYLQDFVKTDLTPQALANMDAVFAELRSRGMHAVLRFAYDPCLLPGTSQMPYTVQDIQRTIAQVAPIVDKNKDVVTVWQSGFVGCWGEWGPNIYSLQSYASSITSIMTTLVENLPDGVPTMMRYPWLRQAVDDPTGTVLPKIGFNNDYFTLAAGGSDYYLPGGSYDSYYQYTLDAAPDVAVDGEMPWDRYQSNDPYAWSQPIPGDLAASRLQSMHYTTLSMSHNAFVTLPVWKTTALSQLRAKALKLPLDPGYFTNAQGQASSPTQFEYIRDHLGYRLGLQSLALGGDADTLTVSARIANTGFAAPIKNYPVVFQLADASGTVVATAPVDTDTRTWKGATAAERVSVAPAAPTYPLTASIPLTGLPAGHYTLRLAIGDPTATLDSVQLANAGVTFVDGVNEVADLVAAEEPAPTPTATATTHPTATVTEGPTPSVTPSATDGPTPTSTPTQTPAPTGPTATINGATSATVPQGVAVTLVGHGFQPGEQVSVTLDGGAIVVGTYTADARGDLTVSFTPPLGFVVGSHSVRLSGASGSVTVGFDVTTAALPTPKPPPGTLSVGTGGTATGGGSAALIVLLAGGALLGAGVIFRRIASVR